MKKYSRDCRTSPPIPRRTTGPNSQAVVTPLGQKNQVAHARSTQIISTTPTHDLVPNHGYDHALPVLDCSLIIEL